MPFRVNPKNKKCVQVKKSGKWQHKGCTDGPVKKYLAALYANTKDINESEDEFDWAKEISSDIEKNIGFKYNIPLENKKNEYYLIWFKKPGIEKKIIADIVNYIQNKTVWKFYDVESTIDGIFDYYKNRYGYAYIVLKPFDANRYGAAFGVTESAFSGANNGILFSDVKNVIEILPEKNDINESEDDWYGDLLKDLGTKEWQIYFDEINDLLKGSQFEILVSRNPDVGLVIKLKKKDDFIFIDAWSEKFFKPHNVWGDIDALIRYYETSNDSEYYDTLLELYELLIPFFRKHRVLGNISEESSDDDWWADIVKSPLDILKFKGKEIMIDVRNLEADRLEQLINIIKQYSTTNHFCLNKALTNPTIITISLHCAHEESDYQPEPGYVCCLRNSYEEELNNDEINLDLITPLKGDHILSFYLNESSDDDWWDDIVNSFQEKVLVTIDNWDRFKNIKVVRGPDWEWDNQDNYSYGYIEDFSDMFRNDNWVKVYWLDGSDNSYRIGPENYDLYFDFSNKEDKNLIKEGVYDRITGKAVKDIMHILNDITDDPEKETEYFFSLPEENDDFSEYEQDNLQFSVDLIVRYDENINNGFEVLSSVTHDENVNVDNTYNDEYDDDEYNDYNVLSIIITLDPKAGKTFFDKIYYKLNEDIRHEIEHLKQEGPNAVPGRPKPKLFKKTFYHHKNLAEIPALVRGFYRRAKLERRPIDEIMIEDLDKEVKTGSLTEDEKESLLQIWIDYSKRNLPSAIYKFF